MQSSQSQQSFDTLDIQVRGLEADVTELKDGIAGLDAKIEKSIASLAHEVRSAVTALSNQFTERQRTPWGVLISAAGFMVLVLGLFGSQALYPIMSEIKTLKEQSFPREEGLFRYSINDKRLNAVETAFLLMQQRRYDELQRAADRLEADNRDLRRPKP